MRTPIVLFHAIIFFASFTNARPPKASTLLPRAEGVSGDTQADAGADTGLEADSADADAQWPQISFPYIGGSTAEDKRKVELKKRADAVKAAFVHSWEPYKAFGLPDDELRPASREPYSTRSGQIFHFGMPY
jgi:hypothetical protein